MATALVFEQAPVIGTMVDLVFGGTTMQEPVPEVVNPNDLLFSRPPVSGPSVNLVFGETTAQEPVPDPDPVPEVMGPNDLLFSLPPVTGAFVNLVFGKTEEVAGELVDVTINGQLPQATLTALLACQPVTDATLAASLPQPTLTAAMDAEYISNTARPTVGQVAAVAQVAQPVESGLQHFEHHATRTVSGAQSAFVEGMSARGTTAMGFVEAIRTQQGLATGFEDASRLPASRLQSTAQNASRAARDLRTTHFTNAARAPLARLRGRFQDGLHDRRPQARTSWQQGTRRAHWHQEHAGPALARQARRGSRFQEGRRPPAGIAAAVALPPVPVQYTPSAHLLFWETLSSPHLVFGRSAPPPSATLYILPARFYMTTHNVFAQRLPDLVEVPLFDATVAADAGSYCWTLSASGPASLFELLAPVSGLPVQLRVTMDGIPWVFAVDSIQRSHAFGKTGISLSGRSVTALIGAPYLRATTRDNAGGSALAQQLALSALALTGVGLDWGLTDWLVPAGAWSHSGTPLDAVQAIAQAAGGYLQSHRSAATLLARHPYSQRTGDQPGAPWGWMTGPADVELAPDAIITEGLERKDGPDINAVYVSGTTHGVLAQVKRTGSAADKLAAMVTDALITDAIAARQRGLSVLGAAGAKYSVRLDLPVLTGLGQPGVLDVGQLVQINTAQPWRGRVRSVSVNAKRPSLRQTVTLERHLENV